MLTRETSSDLIEKLEAARDPKFLEIQEIVRHVEKKCEDGWMKARGLTEGQSQHAALVVG